MAGVIRGVIRGVSCDRGVYKHLVLVPPTWRRFPVRLPVANTSEAHLGGEHRAICTGAGCCGSRRLAQSWEMRSCQKFSCGGYSTIRLAFDATCVLRWTSEATLALGPSMWPPRSSQRTHLGKETTASTCVFSEVKGIRTKPIQVGNIVPERINSFLALAKNIPRQRVLVVVGMPWTRDDDGRPHEPVEAAGTDKPPDRPSQIWIQPLEASGTGGDD